MKTSELEVGKRYVFRANGSKYGPKWSGEVLLTKTAVTKVVRGDWSRKVTTGDGVQMIACKLYGEARHEHEPKVPETIIVRARDVIGLEAEIIESDRKRAEYLAEHNTKEEWKRAQIYALAVSLDIPDPACFVCKDLGTTEANDHDCDRFRYEPYLRAQNGGLFIDRRALLPFLKRVGMDQPQIREALGISEETK